MNPKTTEGSVDEHPSCRKPVCCDPKWRIGAAIFVFACVAMIGFSLGPQTEIDEDAIPAETENTAIDGDVVQASFADQVASVQAGESTRLEFKSIAITDQMLLDLPVSSLASLDTVIADRGVVSDEGLAVLARLPGLEQLRLRHSPITDAGAATLAQCENLWLINLPQSRLSNTGVESFEKLTELTQLRLGSPELDNECCQAIAKLTSLRGLHLIGVPVTDAGLRILATLPHLDSLYLDDSAVTDEGWDWLFEHHPHLHVHVDQQHHDRDPRGHAH